MTERVEMYRRVWEMKKADSRQGQRTSEMVNAEVKPTEAAAKEVGFQSRDSARRADYIVTHRSEVSPEDFADWMKELLPVKKHSLTKVGAFNIEWVHKWVHREIKKLENPSKNEVFEW